MLRVLEDDDNSAEEEDSGGSESEGTMARKAQEALERAERKRQMEEGHSVGLPIEGGFWLDFEDFRDAVASVLYLDKMERAAVTGRVDEAGNAPMGGPKPILIVCQQTSTRGKTPLSFSEYDSIWSRAEEKISEAAEGEAGGAEEGSVIRHAADDPPKPVMMRVRLSKFPKKWLNAEGDDAGTTPGDDGGEDAGGTQLFQHFFDLGPAFDSGGGGFHDKGFGNLFVISAPTSVLIAESSTRRCSTRTAAALVPKTSLFEWRYFCYTTPAT